MMKVEGDALTLTVEHFTPPSRRVPISFLLAGAVHHGAHTFPSSVMASQQRSASATGTREKSYFEQQREALVGDIAMVRTLRPSQL
jgi:hypothetical protein